jgi:hypothetical protein
MPRSYYENLPPALGTKGEDRRVLSRDFRGLGLLSYEETPGAPLILKSSWDILVLVNPEAPVAAALLRRLNRLETRLRLGIIFNPAALREDPPGGDLRTFFGLRGKMRDLGDLAFRDPGLPLPRSYPLYPPAVLKAPAPFAGENRVGDSPERAPEGADKTVLAGGGRFVIQNRFSLLRSPEYKEEQEWFPQERFPPENFSPDPREAPYLPSEGRDFSRLDRDRRSYFLYWRGGFRQNRALPSDPGYITLYARELILAMGKGEAPAYFRELLRLWRSYREALPELDALFPRWLFDFGILYRIPGETLPLLYPYRGDLKIPILNDLYLHHRYIEEDQPLLLADLPLPPTKPGRPSPEDMVLEADRYLRERYGKGLFLFFYPSRGEKQTLEAFPGLSGVGESRYTAEWIPMGGHKPLAAFLEKLLGTRENPAVTGGGTFRREQWRARVETALGRYSGPQEPPPQELPLHEPSPQEPSPRREGDPQRGLRLEAETLHRLREESDQVRELLWTGGEEPSPPPREAPAGENTARQPAADLGEFLAGLGGAEREALALIARGGEGTNRDLAELARKNRIMPETLMENLNGAFWEFRGDLLVDTLDGRVLVLPEYRDGVSRFFQLQRGVP